MPRPSIDGGSARPTDWWILGLDGDPMPGDPFVPSVISVTFSEIAGEAETAHRGVFALLSDPALNSWLGQAGKAFYRAFEPFPQQLGAMNVSYEDASHALDAYQSVFADSQGIVDGAFYAAQSALAGVGLTAGDVQSLAGLGDQAYVDQLARILVPRQKPDPPQDPGIPHPSPGPPPGYVPLNDSSSLSTATQQVIRACVDARKAAQAAIQDFAPAVSACVKALNTAAQEAVTSTPWSGSGPGAYGGGTFDQRFHSFGGDPADLRLAPAAGQDVQNATADPPDVPRYDACRDFIFSEIAAMLASDQFKEIQALLQQADHPAMFNDPGRDIGAAVAEWAAMVGPGQPWDFKGKIQALLGKYPTQPGETHQYTRFDENLNVELYDNLWANISYGYVGRAAGFSAGDLQHGAELNAYLGGGGKNTQGNYVGRQIGIDLYEHYKPGQLTPQAIDDEIYAHLDQLTPYSEYQSFPSPLQQPPADWKGGDLPNNRLY